MARQKFRIKRRLAQALSLSGVTPLMMAAQSRWLGGRFVRAINCHATPAVFRDSYRRQLEFYRRHFCDVTLDDLAALVHEGRWDKPRPGLIITFDDGLWSNYRVAAPLLEEFGFTGWYFLPTDFIDAPPTEQPAFARRTLLDFSVELRDPESQQRLAMNWDEVRELSQRHVIGSHTRSHCRMNESLTPEQLAFEIVESRRILEGRLQTRIRVYCWVGGETQAYTSAAARQIAAAGYEFAFVTTASPIRPRHDPLQLHRSQVEVNWPLDLVRFQLSGIVDWGKASKRRQVADICRLPTDPARGAT